MAAAREVFGERGFEGATLSAIAARVGLSPAALLRHAPTKQALFEAAMAPGEGEPRTPLEFLAEVDAAAADPAAVLRRAGEAFVPFLDDKLGQTLALWMRTNALAADPGHPERLPLAFDRDRHPTPPERVVALLEGYLRRAIRARRLHVPDARATALAVLAAFHGYVVLHRVARIFDPPLPLDRYLDSLTALWRSGLAPARPARAGKETR